MNYTTASTPVPNCNKACEPPKPAEVGVQLDVIKMNLDGLEKSISVMANRLVSVSRSEPTSSGEQCVGKDCICPLGGELRTVAARIIRAMQEIERMTSMLEI